MTWLRRQDAQLPASLPRTEGMRQRAPVHVLQFAAQRHAVREPARRDLVLARELGQVMRGRLALDGRIGRDDQFPHLAFAPGATRAGRGPSSRGPMPSSGDSRPCSTKYRPRKPVACSIASRSAGDSTTHNRCASREALAQVAHSFGLAEVAAARAMADALDRLRQCFGQPLAAFALALEHVVGHALRRSSGRRRAGTRSASISCSSNALRGEVRRQNGSFIPAAAACRRSPPTSSPATPR